MELKNGAIYLYLWGKNCASETIRDSGEDMTLNIYEMRVKLKIMEGGERRGGCLLMRTNHFLFCILPCLHVCTSHSFQNKSCQRKLQRHFS